MPSAVLVSQRAATEFELLQSALQAKGLILQFTSDYRNFSSESSLCEAEIVFLDSVIGNEEIRNFSSFAAQQKIKSIPVVCFDGHFDPQFLLDCGALYNHFIFDIHSEPVVNKKISNLLSLISLRTERNRLKEVEKNLEQESEKLVEVNVSNVQLIAEVNRQNRLLDLAKRDIQNLLDNLDQGFFTLGRDGTIQTGFSKAVLRIFETPEPAGKPFADLLRLTQDKAAQVKDWIDLAFGDLLPAKDLAELGPRTFSLNGSYVELDYRLIRGDSNVIEKLIVIATDKTVEKALEAKAKAEENHARMILAIVRDRDAFADFVEEARKIVRDLGLILRGAPARENVVEAFRMAHTLKGNSAAFGLEDVRITAHELESRLAELRDILQHERMTELLPVFEKVEAAFTEALSNISADLGDAATEAARQKAIPVRDIHLFKKKLQLKLPKDEEIIQDYFDVFIHDSLEKILQRYVNVIAGLGARLNKEAHLEINTNSIKLNVDPYKPLLQSMIHIFRNALDHGIEPPKERETMGKPRTGKLVVSVDYLDSSRSKLRISVQDDGRGVDPEVIRSVALKRGVLSKQELDSMNPRQLLNLLFMSSFSTKEEVSEYSGRGVGLDAVAAEAAKLGGTASIGSEPGKGTCIEIHVPVFLEYDKAAH